MWVHRLAATVAGATLLLIFVGATVTTYDAGDSEPTWNVYFWEWFARLFAERLPGGLFYEILHRAVGTLVGFLAIALALALWRREPRRWVRRLGWIALAGVVAAGLLGAVRVRAVPEGPTRSFLMDLTGRTGSEGIADALAMIHSPLAQSVFALMVVIALVTSRAWTGAPAVPTAQAARIRRLSLLTAGFVFVQMILGAAVRYLDGAGLLWHIFGALIVLVHAVLVGARVLSVRPRVSALHAAAVALMVLVGAQLFLGIGAWMVTTDPTAVLSPSLGQALVRTGHVVVGALILAVSVALSLLAHARLEPAANDADVSASALEEARA